ncbi:MAG: hypothetical protein IJ181_10905, partial [Acidaminococcaceae bacterium]|nr:hypothetical protein [Acidaminococcaceae bacterium]
KQHLPPLKKTTGPQYVFHFSSSSWRYLPDVKTRAETYHALFLIYKIKAINVPNRLYRSGLSPNFYIQLQDPASVCFIPACIKDRLTESAAAAGP